MMPNWLNSKGITAEIEYAESIGKPVVLIEVDDYNE